MGLCMSSISMSSPPPERESDATAKVVSHKGELHLYTLPVVASQVLRSEVGGAPDWFICDSDLLQYDEHMPVTDPAAQLHLGQIYMVLPASSLNRKLSAPDMAALAVKAAIALDNEPAKKRKPTRISPIFLVDDGPILLAPSAKSKAPALRRGMKRGSRRVKLTTIHEGDIFL